MNRSQSRKYCFTRNNPDAEHYALLELLGPNVTYLCYQDEVGENGTPHIQGFVYFPTNKRFNAVQLLLPAGSHIEAARGTAEQAAAYCRKEGGTNFVEFGSVPSAPGKTNRYDEFRNWILEQPTKPTNAAVAAAFPSIFLTSGRTQEFVNLIYPVLPQESLHPYRHYQQSLADRLLLEPDTRKVIFVVDPAGNSGKSWFARKLLLSRPDAVQLLSSGKRDDIAHIVDESKSVFVFDIPRTQLEFFQYGVLEQLKNGVIQSNKYQSIVKILENHSGTAHVVVLTNEYPDYTKLTPDRYETIVWNNED